MGASRLSNWVCPSILCLYRIKICDTHSMTFHPARNNHKVHYIAVCVPDGGNKCFCSSYFIFIPLSTPLWWLWGYLGLGICNTTCSGKIQSQTTLSLVELSHGILQCLDVGPFEVYVHVDLLILLHQCQREYVFLNTSSYNNYCYRVSWCPPYRCTMVPRPPVWSHLLLQEVAVRPE